METVAITGVNGFLGSEIARFLQNKGYNVVGLTRKGRGTSSFEERHFDLSAPLSSDLLDGVDILIHCAVALNDSDSPETSVNIQGTKQLLELARKKSLKKILFFSTTSAHPKALSAYGKSKLFLEQFFNRKDEIIIKPGLVIGSRGLGHNLIEFVRAKSMIPLVGGGVQPMQTIALSSLLDGVLMALQKDVQGTLVLAHPEHQSYRDFFSTIADVLDRKVRFVSIPYPLMSLIAHLGEALKIKLPFSRENLLGLRGMVELNSDESLRKLEIDPPSFRRTLEMLLNRKKDLSS